VFLKVHKPILSLGIFAPNAEFAEIRGIIHSFSKLLGRVSLSLALHRRRNSYVNKHLNHSNVVVDSMEDLIENALQ
jgi:hypothetical protein